MCIYIYIYIYVERERDTVYICVYIYIYIYISLYIYTCSFKPLTLPGAVLVKSTLHGSSVQYHLAKEAMVSFR